MANVRRPAPGWQLPEAEATPERVYRDRRRLLLGLGGLGIAAVLGRPRVAAAEGTPGAAAPGCDAGARGEGPSGAAAGGDGGPVAESGASGIVGYPAVRNERFVLDRPVTAEALVAAAPIFDEMGADRARIPELARGLVLRPWTVHVGGQVSKPLTLDVDQLAARLGLEERLYRHRCVEAWSMAVPWTGFPLRKLIELAQPSSKARFVRFVSFSRPEQAPGWYATKRVFPYYEALTLEEATNELAFVATGIYGHPLPAHHGGPLRLVLPWKYGFKSAKSIVSIQLGEQRFGTFWNDLSPGNYSWTSNVDPSETHPWSQAEETPLGSTESRKTLPFNGYGEWVAKLYG
jgi:sulfoxide reductase catalytic subunit YedY